MRDIMVMHYFTMLKCRPSSYDRCWVYFLRLKAGFAFVSSALSILILYYNFGFLSNFRRDRIGLMLYNRSGWRMKSYVERINFYPPVSYG